MAGVSLVTGKTWAAMNNAEKAAHVIARGEDESIFSPADLKAGQKWLNTNVGGTQDQINLFVDVRDAAGERIEAGTFNQTDPKVIANAIRLARLAKPAWQTDSPFAGVATSGEATLGYSTRDPVDLSNFTVIDSTSDAFSNPNQNTGAWDDNSGWTLYNPENGEYESYSNTYEGGGRNPFSPGNGNTGWYRNSDGNFVLGFLPSSYHYADDGTGSGSIMISGPPSGGGGGGNDGNDGNDDGGGGVRNPEDPDGFPVYPDWPGYDDVPFSSGDGTFVEGNPPSDTSWDWGYFRDKAGGDRMWGGYDEDYQAFERYQPGMDSPWGMPNIEGGNEDFYQQQFVNLLRDEQGFDARQRESQRRQQEAYDNPYEPAELDWTQFANSGQGLPEVVVGTGINPKPTYQLGNNFTKNTTDGQVLETLKGLDIFNNESDQANFTNWLGNGAGSHTGTSWVNRMNNPSNDYATERSNFSQGNDFTGRIFDSIYSRSPLGPVAPIGYAQPGGFGSNYNTEGN